MGRLPSLLTCMCMLVSCANEQPVIYNSLLEAETDVTTEDAGPEAPEVWLPAANEPMPERFGEFLLYPDAPNLALMATGVHGYEPRFPLWSNGSAKYRAVAVPGAEEPPSPNELPEGTMFFKTFAYDADNALGERPVESRVIRKGPDGWEYHRYTWNEAGTEAYLNTSPVQEYAQVEVDGERFEHEIPNETDCKRCHDAADQPILGYREVQLEDFSLDAPDELSEQVMGYAVGNCVHCHNGRSSDANSFDLSPNVFLEAVVGRMTEGSGSGVGIRVVPGEPEASILFVALSGGDTATEVQPMPPIGVQRRDREGIELFRDWIANLEN